MLDQQSTAGAVLDGPVVPPWACALAPRPCESRVHRIGQSVSARIDAFQGPTAGLVTAVVPHATELSATELRGAVTEVFGLVLEGLGRTGFPHPVRMWSFVPGIHDHMSEGMDRYRVFNAGRHAAFLRWFGAPETFDKVLPAASAVGHDGFQLSVSALGLGTPGVPIDNARQTPAYRYSQAHGPQPPCFSRAMIVDLAAGARLLVSGTASIRGENSVHGDSVERQVRETFENLDHLVRGVRGAGRFSLDGVESARVYFPRAADRETLVAHVSARLPAGATVEYVPALICRAELLVEIEATLAPTPW
jgi:chorismate lyase/3-hydroxybenzoate synthase